MYAPNTKSPFRRKYRRNIVLTIWDIYFSYTVHSEEVILSVHFLYVYYTDD